MVAAKPSQMEKLSPCPLAFPKSVRFARTCPESLSRNFADSLAMSLASLTWISLSFLIDSLTLYSMSLERCSLTLHSLSQTGDRFPSLTLHSLSFAKGILHSLILQSLSLNNENCLQRMSFREVSFNEGRKELEESLAHHKLDRRAETSSFSSMSFEVRMLAPEAGTNSFSPSLSKRNLSLRMCLRIFFLCSLQLVCAALLLGNSSFRMNLPTESLQADQLQAAYFRRGFQPTS